MMVLMRLPLPRRSTSSPSPDLKFVKGSKPLQGASAWP